ELNILPDQWQYAMNRALPDDIFVKHVSFVDASFHCRYDCVGKTYRYKVYQSPNKNPFECGLKAHVPESLDFEKMSQAASLFMGRHELICIYNKKTEVESKVRTLYESRIEKTEYGFDYVVTGSGFLYNMVRVLVAFLIGVGKEKFQPASVPQLLNAK